MYRKLTEMIGGLGHIGRFNRNCRLVFLSSMLTGAAQGAFTVSFNLYVLALGIRTDVLGKILSASPLAHAVGSIPAGFLAELVGYKNAFTLIFSLTGMGQLLQVSFADPLLIGIGAFIAGLAFTGGFVVRNPFLTANTSAEMRTEAYSTSSILMSIASALGALWAGFGPNLFRGVVPDLATAYRYTLYIAAFVGALSLIPTTYMSSQMPKERREVSWAPYLWGIDLFTVQNAIVALFMGLAMGIIGPFANIYFVKHLGTTREFFSTISALTLFPSIIGLSLGPVIAKRLGRVRAVTVLHLLVPVFVVMLAVTNQPWLGTVAYWGYRVLFTIAPIILVAFMIETATPKAKVAAAAWHNGSFWLGQAIAAPIAGYLLNLADYATPAYLAAAAAIALAVCNQVFFGRLEKRASGR
jgi:MFS family permease